MKTITLLLFTAFLALSCSITKYDNTYHPFSDGVEFKVQYVTLAKYSDAGENRNYQYIAKKGGRIIQVQLKLKNNTQEDKKISLKDFYIIGQDNTKYEPVFVSQSGKFNGVYWDELEVKLKANKEKTFLVQFKPGISKDAKVTKVLVNDNEYEINMAAKD